MPSLEDTGFSEDPDPNQQQHFPVEGAEVGQFEDNALPLSPPSIEKTLQRLAFEDNRWRELAQSVHSHQLENGWSDELSLVVLSKLPHVLKTKEQFESLKSVLDARMSGQRSVQEVLIASFYFAKSDINPLPKDISSLADFREQITRRCENSVGIMLDVCETDGPRMALNPRANEMFEFATELLVQIDRDPNCLSIKPESVFLHAHHLDRVAQDEWDFALVKEMLIRAPEHAGRAKTIYDRSVTVCELLSDLPDVVRELVRVNIDSALQVFPASNQNATAIDKYLLGTTHLLNADRSGELADLFHHCVVKSTEYERAPSIGSWFNVILAFSEPNIHSQMRETFKAGVESGRLFDKTHFDKLAKELAAHAYASSIRRNDINNGPEISKLRAFTGSLHLQAAKAFIGLPAKAARFALAQDDMKLDRLQKFHIARMMRHYEVHHGFGALMYECRKLSDGSPSLMERFASTIGTVNSHRWSAKNTFPEAGYWIKELDPSMLFVPDTRHPKDPFHSYKRAWPTYAHELQNLHRAEFILARGFIAVIPPENDKHSRILTKSVDEQCYSLVIFNDHFENPDAQVAHLVPTNGLRRALESLNPAGSSIEEFLDLCSQDGLTINVGEARSIMHLISLNSSKQRELQQVRTDMKALKEAQEGQSYPVLRKLPIPRFMKDFVISHDISQSENAIAAKEVQAKALEQELQAHLIEVSALTLICHNYFDVMRIGYSKWKKGQTRDVKESIFPEKSVQSDKADSDQRSESSDEPPIPEMFMSTTEAHSDPKALRMLAEAYKIHFDGHKLNLAKRDFPLLTIASPLGYWNAPPSDFVLDTFDLSLRIGNTQTQLSAGAAKPSLGDGIEWAMTVLPLAEDGRNRFRDFRLVDRSIFQD